MGFIKEFKEFAMRGNVIDMAVGIVIGSAFGKIVSSLVNDVIMPPIGMMLGGVNFTELQITIKAASVDAAGQAVNAVTLNWGNFVQVIFDFVIIAFAIFLVIKGMNTLKKKKEAVPAPPVAPPPPSKEQELLTEIRDLLKKP
jgi:large conductance mechanosensitive channel